MVLDLAARRDEVRALAEDILCPALQWPGQQAAARPYNLSLGSALIHHLGEQKTEEWAKGLVANFARAPKGGDTDQIRAVAAGECGVSISNTYYIARLLRSEKPEDKKAMEEAVAEGKAALGSLEGDRIKKALEALNAASHKMAEKMYQQAPPADGQAPPAPGAPGGDAKKKEDDVIDAEVVS